VRVDGFERAEIAVEKLADHFAKPGIVLGEAGRIDDVAAGDKRFFEEIDLGALAAAVDSFNGDEFSRVRHTESQSNRRVAALQRRACYDLNLNMATTSIRENLLRIKEQMSASAQRAGRQGEEITLIGVSKTHPTEAIREAYAAGLRQFGENRVQEWEGKQSGIQGLRATWHLIGHLQSNKASKAAKFFDSIDSVDNFVLAQKLNRVRNETEGAAKLRVLIEVRIAKEEAKSGAEIDELPVLAEQTMALPLLDLAGLMCIPPFTENAEESRPYFRRLRELRDGLEKRIGRALPVLSMGMSHDFEVAIEEGATEVRVGTALFGMRSTFKTAQ
jgi:PLP dependent protein